MASTATRRLWYANYACEKYGDFPEIILRGKRSEVCPATVEAWLALDLVLTVTGYIAVSVGTQNCRPITGGRELSLHAYGIAVDFDPFGYGNPYYAKGTWKGARFSWNETKFTPSQIDAVEKIRTVGNKQVWRWGGRWLLSKDYMHFEIDVPPKDLDEKQGGGINWHTVLGLGDLLVTLTQIEIQFLRDMIAGALSLDPPSNADSLKVLIQDYRERKANG